MTNRKIKVISATFGYIESMDKLIQYLADKGFDLENTTHPQWELVKELDNWIEVEYDEKYGAILVNYRLEGINHSIGFNRHRQLDMCIDFIEGLRLEIWAAEIRDSKNRRYSL